MARSEKRVPDSSNPILNSPYEGPELHYATDGSGNLNYDDVRDGRRIFTLDTPTIPLAQTQEGIVDIDDLVAAIAPLDDCDDGAFWTRAQAASMTAVWNNDDDERAAELAFMHAQESSMRRFWKETEDDDL